MPGFTVDLNYSSAGAMSWNGWIDRMLQRASRAAELHGTLIQVHTLATMTPYDSSAGGTKPIMHYLTQGWEGKRARMMPRWPEGVAPYIHDAKPYRDHMSAINRWVILGPGMSLPDNVSQSIWDSMADWIEENLFATSISPKRQWDTWRSGRGCVYGPRGSAPKHIIQAWERMGGGDEIKQRASAPAKFQPDKFADVYAKRGRGFLETMREKGMVVENDGGP